MCSFTQELQRHGQAAASPHSFRSIIEKGKFWLGRTLQTLSTVLDEINRSSTWVKQFRNLNSKTETSLCQTHKFLKEEFIQTPYVIVTGNPEWIRDQYNSPNQRWLCPPNLAECFTARNPSETWKELFWLLWKI